jgi:hypothetical protein
MKRLLFGHALWITLLLAASSALPAAIDVDARLDKWTTDIDTLVKDTRKACLEAKASEDLDPLLLRCSALQMQATRNSDAMSERLNFKLQGLVHTLSGWTAYLDFHNAGDGKHANESLRKLTADSAGFPVLGLKEIEERIVETDAQIDVQTALEKVFASVKSPDDLPVALERLQGYARNPQSLQLSSLGGETDHVRAYIDAWKAAQSGDTAAAMATLNRSFGGLEYAQRYYSPLKAQIEAHIVKAKMPAWTKLAQNIDESTQAYLGRVLDDLKARNEWATILEVATFANQVDRSSSTLSSANRQAIEQFLAGQRFEKIGDGLAAVTSYRIAVGLPAGKYSPIDSATEALKGLQAKYPEAFKSYDGVVLEQLRALTQQVQILQSGRPPGFPYRP